MEKASYIIVESWMITELELSGNNLLVYALIYGFSRDGVSVFFGNYDYVKKMTGISSSKTISSILNYLVERKLIVKDERYTTTGKSNGYKVVLHNQADFVNKEVQKGVENTDNKEMPEITDLSMVNESNKNISFDEIFTDFMVDSFEKQAFLNFIRHCQINGRKVTNDKLERLIVKLDLMYGKDSTAKINALNMAVDKGYFDIKDIRI